MTIAKKADYLVVLNIAFNYCFELPFETAPIKTKFSITGQAFLALFLFFFSFFSFSTLYWVKNTQKRSKATMFFTYSCTFFRIKHNIVSISRKLNIFSSLVLWVSVESFYSLTFFTTFLNLWFL